MNKPFSQACENNKQPILNVLRQAFAAAESVLEIGSGTGQHAVHFARHLPHLHWQPSDVAANIAGIKLWLTEAALDNLAVPLELDVNQAQWHLAPVDGVYSANTLHIMSQSEVERFFDKLASLLKQHTVLCLYGPFNYSGQYTSPSNAQFDCWLKQQNPHSAIRDFEWIDSLAVNIGLTLYRDHAMPANNRLLEYHRADPSA